MRPHRGDFKPPFCQVCELVFRKRNTSAGSAQRERRPDNIGKPEFSGDFPCLIQRFSVSAAGQVQADIAHGRLEKVPVFSFVNCVDPGPDQFDAVFFENARFVQLHGAVEGRLTAYCGQESVRAFLLDDPGKDVHFEGFNIGGICKFRIGHDRGRVGVHQYYPVTLLFERLQGLGSGIVELTGLTDDDGAGPDQKN